MKVRQLKIEAPQRALIAEAGDNEAFSRTDMLWMLEQMQMQMQMQIIRAFEEKILELKDDGLVNGPVHTRVGQEAVAVGADVTVLTYGWGVRLAERALDRLAADGVTADLIDLRILDDAGAAILRAARRQA